MQQEMLWSSVIKMIYEHLEITHILSCIFPIFMILLFFFFFFFFQKFQFRVAAVNHLGFGEYSGISEDIILVGGMLPCLSTY